MNEKQQQLLFDKGITNVPSDALCSDNTLAESVGMVYVDGEHKVIQKPESYITGLEGTLLYVHKFNDQERYVCMRSEDREHLGVITTYYVVYWRYKDSLPTPISNSFITEYTNTQPSLLMSTIGKTLIISDDEGICYYLWKEDKYSGLDDLPSPNVKFWLANRSRVKNSGSFEEIIDFDQNIDDNKILKQEDYNDLVTGLYAKNKKAVAQAKRFCNPFYARCALELYDGTYTKITNPVLLFPSVSKNTYSFTTPGIHSRANQLYLTTDCYDLYVEQIQNYTDWSDIVKNVVVFISDDVDIYDVSIDQDIKTLSGGDMIQDAVFGNEEHPENSSYTTKTLRQQETNSYEVLQQKAVLDLTNDITGVSNYYKLCEIGIKPTGYLSVKENFETHLLENIVTQERIDDDEYFSHCKVVGNYTYSYNSRLNIANNSRTFFEGFDFFTPYYNSVSDTHVYKIYVKIETDTKDIWIEHQAESATLKQGLYFYYPDPRAKHLTIYKDTTAILDEELKEHPALHGAYFFKGMASVPNYAEAAVTVGQDGYVDQEISNDETETLANYIIQSEVNNPFVFKADGYFKVGTGKILAMSSITQALSEGQFGQFPLLVFSESGIWALSVASTGYYDSIHPISREISYDPTCIVQTDGAVFFTSKKGLMVVVGNQVKCVSEQLSGKTNVFKDANNNSLVIDLGDFNDYLKNAFIAYDYRDSLLWIFNTTYTTCYIYSMKSGTISKFTPATKITNVVNNYPDYLLQAGTTIYSLTERKDINSTTEQSNNYSTAMLTRPMKLENALALKSIMQVKHIYDFNDNATLTLRIFASNDLKHWFEMSSIRGVPWKYYRFRYDFANLKATDRFAGTMLITQERRTNKLR